MNECALAPIHAPLLQSFRQRTNSGRRQARVREEQREIGENHCKSLTCRLASPSCCTRTCPLPLNSIDVVLGDIATNTHMYKLTQSLTHSRMELVLLLQLLGRGTWRWWRTASSRPTVAFSSWRMSVCVFVCSCSSLSLSYTTPPWPPVSLLSTLTILSYHHLPSNHTPEHTCLASDPEFHFKRSWREEAETEKTWRTLFLGFGQPFSAPGPNFWIPRPMEPKGSCAFDTWNISHSSSSSLSSSSFSSFLPSFRSSVPLAKKY